MESSEWYKEWFNRDYLELYSNRNAEEAESQVEFIIKRLELTGDELVLDLACGSGRHAIPLAKRGFHVVGVDGSKELIELALEALRPFPALSLSFQIGDMKEMDYNHAFDVVISMFTSFGYFETDRDNFTVFEAVRKCLKQEGQFFFDFLNPEYLRSHLIEKEEKQVKGKTVKIERKIENDRAYKTIHFPHHTYTESIALYSEAALKKALRENRLEPIQQWGNYDGSPFSKESKRQIFRCKAV